VAYTSEGARILGARNVKVVSYTVTPAGRGGPKREFPLVSLRSEYTWEA
jgi:hypothetical protein